MNEKRWLKISEAANYFNCPAKSLYAWIARGLVPREAILRLGARGLRINVEKVEQLLTGRK